jgi:hypothetical protein
LEDLADELDELDDEDPLELLADPFGSEAG